MTNFQKKSNFRNENSTFRNEKSSFRIPRSLVFRFILVFEQLLVKLQLILFFFQKKSTFRNENSTFRNEKSSFRIPTSLVFRFILIFEQLLVKLQLILFYLIEEVCLRNDKGIPMFVIDIFASHRTFGENLNIAVSETHSIAIDMRENRKCVMDKRQKMFLVWSFPNFSKCCSANGATEVWTIYQLIELPKSLNKVLMLVVN